MTRIISGTAGGRRLRTPSGAGTRPTSDRVREALFSRLEHRGLVADARVLDLYAGSGALGLEAVSRGAASVVLVESAPGAVAAIRANLRTVEAQHARILAEPVERALAAGRRGEEPVDLVLVDPPYDLTEEALAAVLRLLVEQEWLAPDAFVVVERSSRSPQPAWPDGLELSGEKRYGETTVWFAEPPPPEDVA